MVIFNSGKAIGSVSNNLLLRLTNRINKNPITGEPNLQGVSITIGKTGSKKLELVITLYEIQFDNSMNSILFEGVNEPIWLVLKYLITAYDKDGYSDSIEAHEILSCGIQALKEIHYLEIENDPALQNNPEPLKITFDNINPDILSKLIQGTNEVFRVSVGFQVRPVLISPIDIPKSPMLVGVDYTNNSFIGYSGVHFDISVMRQPVITGIFPSQIICTGNTCITLSGSDLDMSDLWVQLGPMLLPVTSQKSDELQFILSNTAGKNGISAGNLPISVIKVSPDGRRKTSNILNCQILPVLTSAKIDSSYQLKLTGTFLGWENDEIIVILLLENKPVYLFDRLQCNLVESQDTLTIDCTYPFKCDEIFDIPRPLPLKPGQYQVVVWVNGQQAHNRPGVTIP